MGIKKTDKLARYKCDNGFTFYLGNNIGINSPQRVDIEAACKTWSDYLNIDVKLSLIQQPPLVDEFDNMSIISIADPNILNTTTIGMKTFKYFSACNTAATGTYNEAFCMQADIIINPNYQNDFHYGNDDWLPPGKLDFYVMILHEIGHALGLKHVMSDNDIMFRYPAEGAAGTGTLANERITLTSTGCVSPIGELVKVIYPSQTTQFYVTCPNINTLVNKSVSSPTITSTNNSFCSNNPITLSSSTPNYTIFGYSVSNQWSTAPSSTTQSVVVTPPGTYTLTVTQSNLTGPPNTCTSTASTVTLIQSVITTQPLTQFYSCNSSSIDIDITAPFGSTFQWQRSNNTIDWIDLKDDFIYYMGVTSTQLNIIFVNGNFGNRQYYRCKVTNGPYYCQVISDLALLNIGNVTLATFTPVFTGDPSFQLTGGWPPGGSYSGNGSPNFICNDPPNCFDCTYFPPAVNSTPLNPPVDIISYRIDGCLPDPVSKQIQIIYCISTPPCDAIVTNIGQGIQICLKQYPYLDIPFSAFCTFNPGNVFSAYLTDATNSFATPLPGCALHSNGTVTTFSGTIHCQIPSNIPLATNYRIRIDSDNLPINGEVSPFDIEIAGGCINQRNALTVLNVMLFPNPTSKNVTIEFINSEWSKNEITIIDLQGRVCLTKYFNNETNNVVLNISTLKDGMYIVSIQAGEYLVKKKLTVSTN